MTANTTLVLPNPYTTLAFLPPRVADEFQMSIYVIIGGLSAFVWDWLMSLPGELQFVRKSGLRGLNSVYFLSRFGTLAYCVGGTIFQSANVAHCQALLYVITSAYILAMPATELLFYFRVRAIWNKSTTISVFFGVLWLGTLGTSFVVPFSVNGVHIGPTQHCITTAIRLPSSIPVLINALFDTLVFIAISVRIVEFSSVGDTWRARFRSFVRGDGLPTLSRGLLQSGQLYYFATIGSSIVMSALIVSPTIPPVYRAMLSVPSMAIQNAMGCRVFRNVKLGLIKDDVSCESTAIPSSRLRFGSNHDIALKDCTFDRSRTRQVNVNVEIIQTTVIAQPFPDEFTHNPKKDLDLCDRV